MEATAIGWTAARIAEEKRRLRREARRLRALHAGNADAAAVSFLPALRREKEWLEARTVAMFASDPSGGEPRTDDLAGDAWARGARVALPAWVPDGEFGTCAFPPPGEYFPALFRPDSDMATGPFGIPEPAGKTWIEPSEIDLWLVPGLLFDRSGTRLGHGKGWIDRLLARRRPDTTVFGLAFPWQIAGGPIPRSSSDQPVDRVVVAGFPPPGGCRSPDGTHPEAFDPAVDGA